MIANPYVQYMYSYPHKTAYQTLHNIRFEDYLSFLNTGQQNSLYFHIPFCESKCGYCNLFSLVGQTEEAVNEYLECMERQLSQYRLDSVVFSNLVLGGGTPLYLTINQLDRLFSMARSKTSLTKDGLELLVETSPKQTNSDKVDFLKERGVTRVSIGVQSFQLEELKRIYRSHTPDDTKKALKLLKNAEFPCLNIDLIYGIPGQDVGTLRNSIDQALFYDPDEVFLYPLYVKKDTLLNRMGDKPTEDRLQLYCFIRDYMIQKGYFQTSMRRFIRKAKEKPDSNEGCGYHENTISIGCGGRSYVNTLHFSTPYSVRQEQCRNRMEEYKQTVDYNQITHGVVLTKEERKRQFVIKNLFYYKGISISEYRKLFLTDLFEDIPILNTFLEKQYIQFVNVSMRSVNQEEFHKVEVIQLTDTGIMLSDYLGPMLISVEVRDRMQAWSSLP